MKANLLRATFTVEVRGKAIEVVVRHGEIVECAGVLAEPAPAEKIAAKRLVRRMLGRAEEVTP